MKTLARALLARIDRRLDVIQATFGVLGDEQDRLWALRDRLERHIDQPVRSGAGEATEQGQGYPPASPAPSRLQVDR